MHTPAPLHLNKRGHFHDKGQLLTFIGSACFDISKGCVCVSVCACWRGRDKGAAVEEKEKQGDLMKGAEWENAPTDPQCTNRRGGSQRKERNHSSSFSFFLSFFHSSSVLLFSVSFPTFSLALSRRLSPSFPKPFYSLSFYPAMTDTPPLPPSLSPSPSLPSQP